MSAMSAGKMDADHVGMPEEIPRPTPCGKYEEPFFVG